MEGWWCVRFGDSLAWVEAPTAAAARERSLGLHPLGDWTDDADELVVGPQDAYPENAGPHDYTRAVLSANPPPPGPRRSGPRTPRGSFSRAGTTGGEDGHFRGRGARTHRSDGRRQMQQRVRRLSLRALNVAGRPVGEVLVPLTPRRSSVIV